MALKSHKLQFKKFSFLFQTFLPMAEAWEIFSYFFSNKFYISFSRPHINCVLEKGRVSKGVRFRLQ
jgi:hypothetical protein